MQDIQSKLSAWVSEYASASPQTLLQLALREFERIAISFSGAEDVVLIDMAVKIDPQVKVFGLDTGRLHYQTYRFFERVREHYNVGIEALYPEPQAVEKLVKEKGFFSFYKDGHHECCGIRKVMPLQRKLATLEAWVTGQRQDQSPATRNSLPCLEEDRIFSTRQAPLVKFNPLANWSSEQIWTYIHEHEIPFNELHQQGYVSIGCEPCTRAVLPNQHERLGRWWWEEATKKECGLHVKS